MRSFQGDEAAGILHSAGTRASTSSTKPRLVMTTNFVSRKIKEMSELLNRMASHMYSELWQRNILVVLSQNDHKFAERIKN